MTARCAWCDGPSPDRHEVCDVCMAAAIDEDLARARGMLWWAGAMVVVAAGAVGWALLGAIG